MAAETPTSQSLDAAIENVRLALAAYEPISKRYEEAEKESFARGFETPELRALVDEERKAADAFEAAELAFLELVVSCETDYRKKINFIDQNLDWEVWGSRHFEAFMLSTFAWLGETRSRALIARAELH